MSDIRKNLTLTAQLDDSQLRKQLEILKKEMGTAFNVDAGSLNDLKASIKDIAKEFGAQLRKELEGIRGARGKAAGTAAGQVPKEDVNVSEIGSTQVRQMQVTNMVVNSLTIKGAARAAAGLGAPGLADEEEDDNKQKSMLDRIPGARRLKSMFGTAGVVSAGLTFAGLGVQRAVDEVTTFRRMLIQREQAQTLDVMHGRALEGAVRQSGRGLNFTSGMTAGAGALKYGGAGAAIGAGIGSLFTPVGTAIGAGIGGVAGGIYGGAKGFFAGGEEEAETRARKARPALEALDLARSMRQGRLQAMAGGNVAPTQLSRLQQQGAERFGFMPDETVNQFTQARQFLGNRATPGALPQLQELQRSIGLDVGAGAQAGETFAGAGRTTMAQGVTRMIDTLKKGVAGGLDASKSGQFLKSTADFLQQNAGLGQLDTERIADEMSRSMFGFARGGEATEMDVQRAMTVQQQVRQESTAATGIAGIGNIQAIQQALPNATTGQFLAAQNISETATPEDVQQILGIDADTAKKFLGAKRQNLQTGLETAAPNDQALQLALGARETGQTTEQFLGRRMAEQFQGPMPPGALPEMPTGTKEMDSLIKEATVKQTAFVSGIDLMARESAQVAEKLKTVADEISKTAQYIKDIVGPSAVQVRR